VGDNAHFLVGADKVPENLTFFHEKRKKQAEEFKNSQMRQLRTSAARFEQLAQHTPSAISKYLCTVYSNEIEQKISMQQGGYDAFRKRDHINNDHHLLMFRPNLENPANKEMTTELNAKEIERTEKLRDVSLCLSNPMC
jgi:hypothetical protein